MRNFLTNKLRSIGLLSLFLVFGGLGGTDVLAQCDLNLNILSVEVTPESCQGANDGQALISFDHIDRVSSFVLFNASTKQMLFANLNSSGLTIERDKDRALLKIRNLYPGTFALVANKEGSGSCSQSFGEINNGLFEITSSSTSCNE